MIISNINISLFRIRAFLYPSIEKCLVMHYHGRVDVIAKRGSILKEMIKTNKDKKKNWHLSIITDKARGNIFRNIHKPHRRRAALNTVFIRNITDVISTGEIVPELLQYEIEITGVNISPCFQTLNVFWQVSLNKFDCCEDIGNLLSIAAPKIRAELISRNVIGRVPIIYFIRDTTNARISEYEIAMQKLEQEPKSESPIVADDSFVKDLLVFRDSKTDPVKKSPEPVKQAMKDVTVTNPTNPMNMKSDTFGLNHDEIMDKVVALKKKVKSPPQKSAVISPDSLKNEDLFSKIPGVHFKEEASTVLSRSDRDAIFKRFHIERKMLMERQKPSDDLDDYECYEQRNEENDIEFNPYGEDFVEDENFDK